MRQGDHYARAGPKSEGRPHHRAAPSSIAAPDCKLKIEYRNSPDADGAQAIVIVEQDPGNFVVQITDEGERHFTSHRAAYGFASGRKMISGLPIVDRTRTGHG